MENFSFCTVGASLTTFTISAGGKYLFKVIYTDVKNYVVETLIIQNNKWKNEILDQNLIFQTVRLNKNKLTMDPRYRAT